ncbi:DNA mismatch repair protein MutS [Maribacter algicola]|uniref:DNA mismatch repair protein MutS n=1 Tax=Maribacter algicola TaxID=2498892 RepID=A0A426RKL6_9FLAO|nr:DNA mismatch repair protein MutS [Maribacter algicola]RRQ49510.1 DNA mismatch repair protein MutS [Maribacter algicola]
MRDPQSFYQEEIKSYKVQLEMVKKQLLASSTVRLVVFMLAVFGVYFLYGNTRMVLVAMVVAIAIFLYLVSRHTDLQYKRDKLKKLIFLNETEIQALNRDFKNLPDGSGFKDDTHFYSQDIDLFGNGSFYQYLNRSSLPEGGQLLAFILKENTTDRIEEKQEALKELAQIPKWRQDFAATAALSKSGITTQTALHWILNYTPFVPGIMRFLPWLYTGGSILFFGLLLMGFLPASVLFYWLLLGLLITGAFSKKMTKLVSGTSKIQSIFERYNRLLAAIEAQKFESALLKEKQVGIQSHGRKTSAVLREFAGLLSDLDQNNNLLYLIFGNGLFLRGLFTAFRVEKWISEHKESMGVWFDCIAFFDAHNSLANFVFNHPGYTFPILKENEICIRSKQAGHPLLDPKKCVVNDYVIDRTDFFIITGANMAGKSTFLRTVSLQIVMANIGLPVCAASMEYNPIKLITSMRTSDSLTDEASYFFSELKRLKFIVDEIQKENYFVVLDEILKGTNSKDKAIGSRKFVERLVSSGASGIIATHDLSLCEVAQELPQIKNYYFDAEIIDDELHFDYTFKKGICQNMNASFLLRKMDIIQE